MYKSPCPPKRFSQLRLRADIINKQKHRERRRRQKHRRGMPVIKNNAEREHNQDNIQKYPAVRRAAVDMSQYPAGYPPRKNRTRAEAYKRVG
jgi:hypothetical protein